MSEPVTKEQYEFYRALYDEEERTSLQLEGRAKVYLGVISAFLAGVFLKAADAKSFAETLHLKWALLLLEALPMTVALTLVLWALRIRNLEAVNDGEKLLMDYAEHWPTATQFYEDRMVDYAVASTTNRKLNETAKLLEWSSSCLASGIVYLLCIVVYAIWRA